MNDDYLMHYGIKGMKWGIRRFQNADGSLTAAGKKRYGSGEGTERQKKSVDAKKVAKTAAKVTGAALMAAGVTAAVYYASKNPTVVKVAAKTIGSVASRSASNFAKSTVKKGKNYIKESIKGLGKGIAEGAKNAPERMGRAMAEGAAYIAGMYVVGKLIGGARADDMIKSYNAYNKKNKVGKVTSMDDFIKGGHYDNSKDDDED